MAQGAYWNAATFTLKSVGRRSWLTNRACHRPVCIPMAPSHFVCLANLPSAQQTWEVHCLHALAYSILQAYLSCFFVPQAFPPRQL